MTPWLSATYGPRTRSAMLVASMIVAGLGCAPEKPSQEVALEDLDVDLEEVLELDDGEAIVARINGEEISREEFNRRLSGLADFARMRFQTEQRRRDFLERIIEFEILADEAERQHYGDHLEVRHAMAETMADLTLEEWIASEVRLTDIESDDVERYLEEHREALAEPEERRLAEVWLEEREHAEALAARFEEESAEENDLEMRFRRFAFAHSQRRTSGDQGGDLGWFEAQDSAYGDVSVLELEPGEVVGPVAVDGGYGLVMVIEKREATEPVLQDMEQWITAQLFEERRRQAREDWTGDLTANADVEVYSDAVEALEEKAPERDVPTSLEDVALEDDEH